MDEKNKEVPKKSPGDKPKSGLRTCCIIGLVLGGLIIIIIIAFAIIKSYFSFGSSSSSKEIPIPSAASSSASSPKTSPTASISKEDLLDYFVETTTYDGKMTKRLPVCHWTKNPITVEIQGDINDKTLVALDDAIKEFNAVSNIKMERASPGDLLVYFLPVDQFPANTLSEAIKGIAFTEPDGNCVISSAKIYVDDTEFADSKQLTYHDALLLVTRHELLHALGFSGHDVKKRGCTALSSIACLTYDYTQYDISAIKMLYNSGLPLCSGEADIRQFFANNIPM